ncbi:hypothetical protein Back11_39590 [Paenibacillus baekrokdamisoli]|uniref:Uncharacterized protein n=1 Tax=Paenibacillus baekrokdamisoli TaxID=1712516 RepID=A0A3G9JHW2_9BACL|nr:hypothetical protein [Paenibacillus baekrokdamisoli]MBB3068344.1 hypothetical protein [Paenibacillus baekrokdamisoli]BBH22614.1 hypothetical protein Back11_39590 [Paenibacillus baekrokdamisoli]
MIPKTLLNDMTEKENKLAFLQLKKKLDIQLLASNGEESCAVIDDTLLHPFNLIIAVVSNEGRSCIGQYAKKNFSYHSTLPTNLTRVWVDCRDEGIKFHVNSNGKHFELSNDKDTPNDMLMIVILHCPDFVQLSLYDGQLALQKVSHIFTSSKHAGDKINVVAHSMLNRYFPGLFEHLLQLEGDNHESQ